MKKNVRDLKDRRNDRYDSILIKMKSFCEKSKFYHSRVADELISDSLNLIKDFTVKEAQGNCDNTIYKRWIDINHADKEEYIEKVVDGIRQANEIFIEQDLIETEKYLTKSYINDNIKYIEQKSQPRYLSAVKLLVQLDKINKINEMESEINELTKDLISCIGYNSKIQNETNKDISCNEELTDEFLDDIINSEGEEELELV